MIKNRNIAKDAGISPSKILGGGMVGAANIIYCAKSGGETNAYFESRVDTNSFKETISAAHSAAVSGRNDVIVLSPDSHTQSSALTWSKNMTHLVGAYPQTLFNQRARIGHDADFATLLTVSGYGNLFANLYFMHGRGSATNVNLMTVSGNRNTFQNVHFGGPFNQTEGDAAAYDLIRITGAEEYFKDCVFGTDTIDQSVGSVIELASTSTRVVFENCIFNMRADANAPFFIKILSGGGNRHYYFKNCQFLNWGASALTYGVDFGAALDGTTCKVFFDNQCNFIGVTDIVKATAESYVYLGLTAASTTDTAFGLSTHPNVS